MFVAKADIADFLLVVDQHLSAFLDDVALAVDAGVHGGFAAAPAQAAAGAPAAAA